MKRKHSGNGSGPQKDAPDSSISRRKAKKGSPRGSPSPKRTEDVGSTVGYQNPPVETRFKPGVSGNPKGRPKGSHNLRTAIRKIYMDKVVMWEGEKSRSVTRFEALLRKQLESALKGNERAALAACKMVVQLGLLDQYEEEAKYNLRALSDAELETFELLMRKVYGQD
jgi:hypothetical protein